MVCSVSSLKKENIDDLNHKFGKMYIDDDREYVILSDDEDEVCKKHKTVLGIDIGIKHLAFTLCTYDKTYNLLDIVGLDLIDITSFPHHNLKNCDIEHTKTFADWLEHIFAYYDVIFQNVDLILIERQPPVGLVVVEQLIYYKFRHKSILVSPNSVHKYLRIGHLDYDHRKEEVKNIFEKHVTIPDVVNEYKSFYRKHDIADAFCIIKFWLYKKRVEYLKIQEKDRINKIVLTYNGSRLTLEDWFNQFKYQNHEMSHM